MYTKFSDCTFSYQTSSGITSFGSPINVKNNNNFLGCKNGVAIHNTYALGSNNQSFIGDEIGLANSFTNCEKGIYSNVGYLKLKNNYVDNNNFGFYFSGLNSFESLNNTFSGDSYAEGLYSTGSEISLSYDNLYNSSVGIFPWHQNDHFTFKDNCFNTLWWDVNISQGSQISTAQGDNLYAASNCFSKGGIPDFICESPLTIIYAVSDDILAPTCMTPQTIGNYEKTNAINFDQNGCAGAL
jgi:hypothetical protein